MYFPYLRGKQFELQAMLGVPAAVFGNTLPIVEPVNTSSDRFYLRLAQQNRPFVIVMNPQLPQSRRMPMATIQSGLVDGPLLSHSALTLGYIIGQHSSLSELQTFLTTNPTREKVVIFRHTPMPIDTSAIDTLLRAHSTSYLIFDENRTSPRLRTLFNWHPQHVLITDGFQKQERNSDYPIYSAFDSNLSTWSADGLAGIGDYVTIGDHFQEGGSQPLVVTLHLTIPDAAGLEMHHFSSTLTPTIRGPLGPKFLQACRTLVSSPLVVPLPSSTGITMYQEWDRTAHLPQLGAAKQASLQHHIETLSRIL